MRKFWAFYSILPTLLVFFLLAGNYSAATVAAPDQPPEDKLVQFEEQNEAPNPNSVFDLVNQRRSQTGLSTLVANEKLGQLAKARALDMVSRQYYAHKNPDNKYYYDYFDQFGVRTGYNCENLDLVFVTNEDKVIEEWMTSLRGHKECLMNSEATHAGYSSSKLTILNSNGQETTAYVVVAIHAKLKDL